MAEFTPEQSPPVVRISIEVFFDFILGILGLEYFREFSFELSHRAGSPQSCCLTMRVAINFMTC